MRVNVGLESDEYNSLWAPLDADNNVQSTTKLLHTIDDVTKVVARNAIVYGLYDAVFVHY